MPQLTRLPQHSGFTLIELMTVVAVIGILSAIALPNYQEYLLRAKLVDAGSSLSQIRVALEQYYQDNRAYPDGEDCVKMAVASNSKYFVYDCTISDAGQGYTATAVGTASGGTSAFTYSIDQLNNRKTTAVPNGWNSGDCWITAKGQTCG